MVVASGKSGSGGGNKADSLWDSDNDSITVEVVVWWITMVLVATAVTSCNCAVIVALVAVAKFLKFSKSNSISFIGFHSSTSSGFFFLNIRTST